MTPGCPTDSYRGKSDDLKNWNEPLFLMLPIKKKNKKPTPAPQSLGTGLARLGSQSGNHEGLTFCTWIDVAESGGPHASAVAVALTLLAAPPQTRPKKLSTTVRCTLTVIRGFAGVTLHCDRLNCSGLACDQIFSIYCLVKKIRGRSSEWTKGSTDIRTRQGSRSRSIS